MTTLLNLDRGIQYSLIWVHQLARWDLQKHLAGANGKDLKVSKIPNHNRERFVAIFPGFDQHILLPSRELAYPIWEKENDRLKSAGFKGKMLVFYRGNILLGFTKRFLFVEVFCYVELVFHNAFRWFVPEANSRVWSFGHRTVFLAIDKVGCEMECEIKIFSVATKKGNLN